MAEATPINFQAFAPFQGGVGKRFTAGTTTSSVAIPGLSGGAPADNARVLVTNNNIVSVFVRLGNPNVAATLDSLEILPGNAYLLTPPTAGPGGIYLAAITESGSAYIGVMYGTGT